MTWSYARFSRTVKNTWSKPGTLDGGGVSVPEVTEAPVRLRDRLSAYASLYLFAVSRAGSPVSETTTAMLRVPDGTPPDAARWSRDVVLPRSEAVTGPIWP